MRIGIVRLGDAGLHFAESKADITGFDIDGSMVQIAEHARRGRSWRVQADGSKHYSGLILNRA